MSNRDELAILIDYLIVGSDGQMVTAEMTADTIIAAGWRPPARVVNTVEELDALPVLSHVRLLHGMSAVKYLSGWSLNNDDKWRDAEYVANNDLPATVLFSPDEVNE